MMEVQGDKIRGYGRQLNTYAHQLGHGQPDDASKQVRAENRKPTQGEMDKVNDIPVPAGRRRWQRSPRGQAG